MDKTEDLADIGSFVDESTRPSTYGRNRRSSILKMSKATTIDINEKDDEDYRKRNSKKRVSFANNFQVREFHTGNIYVQPGQIDCPSTHENDKENFNRNLLPSSTGEIMQRQFQGLKVRYSEELGRRLGKKHCEEDIPNYAYAEDQSAFEKSFSFAVGQLDVEDSNLEVSTTEPGEGMMLTTLGKQSQLQAIYNKTTYTVDEMELTMLNTSNRMSSSPQLTHSVNTSLNEYQYLKSPNQTSVFLRRILHEKESVIQMRSPFQNCYNPVTYAPDNAHDYIFNAAENANVSHLEWSHAAPALPNNLPKIPIYSKAPVNVLTSCELYDSPGSFIQSGKKDMFELDFLHKNSFAGDDIGNAFRNEASFLCSTAVISPDLLKRATENNFSDENKENLKMDFTCEPLAKAVTEHPYKRKSSLLEEIPSKIGKTQYFSSNTVDYTCIASPSDVMGIAEYTDPNEYQLATNIMELTCNIPGELDKVNESQNYPYACLKETHPLSVPFQDQLILRSESGTNQKNREVSESDMIDKFSGAKNLSNGSRVYYLDVDDDMHSNEKKQSWLLDENLNAAKKQTKALNKITNIPVVEKEIDHDSGNKENIIECIAPQPSALIATPGVVYNIRKLRHTMNTEKQDFFLDPDVAKFVKKKNRLDIKRPFTELKHPVATNNFKIKKSTSFNIFENENSLIENVQQNTLPQLSIPKFQSKAPIAALPNNTASACTDIALHNLHGSELQISNGKDDLEPLPNSSFINAHPITENEDSNESVCANIDFSYTPLKSLGENYKSQAVLPLILNSKSINSIPSVVSMHKKSSARLKGFKNNSELFKCAEEKQLSEVVGTELQSFMVNEKSSFAPLPQTDCSTLPIQNLSSKYVSLCNKDLDNQIIKNDTTLPNYKSGNLLMDNNDLKIQNGIEEPNSNFVKNKSDLQNQHAHILSSVDSSKVSESSHMKTKIDLHKHEDILFSDDPLKMSKRNHTKHPNNFQNTDVLSSTDTCKNPEKSKKKVVQKRHTDILSSENLKCNSLKTPEDTLTDMSSSDAPRKLVVKLWPYLSDGPECKEISAVANLRNISPLAQENSKKSARTESAIFDIEHNSSKAKANNYEEKCLQDSTPDMSVEKNLIDVNNGQKVPSPSKQEAEEIVLEDTSPTNEIIEAIQDVTEEEIKLTSDTDRDIKDLEVLNSIKIRLEKLSSEKNSRFKLKDFHSTHAVFKLKFNVIFYVCKKKIYVNQLNGKESEITFIPTKQDPDLIFWQNDLGYKIFSYLVQDKIVPFPVCSDQMIDEINQYSSIALRAETLMRDIMHISVAHKFKVSDDFNPLKIHVENVLNDNNMSMLSMTFSVNLHNYPNEKIIPVCKHREFNDISKEVEINASQVEPGENYLFNMITVAREMKKKL